eukprot:CAMPEP_0170552334 /NCGR_PEP_ID=MMETSP0211-20121228/10236_1 /TAXON_ID=311385 /ORGANISM="Pseudokeronopsis sp., Strain OXSARD2" /LENGTH=44 /DNA_ID= /DNA_START= /DNA_END= /DNA_ORIENTATION=
MRKEGQKLNKGHSVTENEYQDEKGGQYIRFAMSDLKKELNNLKV